MFTEPFFLRRMLFMGVLTTGLFALSCGGGDGEEPDDVEFASLDKLVEVTGCIRSDEDSGYYNYSDSGWGWGDSGWSWDSGGYYGDTGSAGTTGGGDTASTDTASTDTAAADDAEDAEDETEAIDTAERAGSKSTAPPKSRPCMPSERIDEVQTASCRDSSSLRGGLLLVVWSLPFLFGRRRSS